MAGKSNDNNEIIRPLKEGLTIWGRFFKALPRIIFRIIKEKL
ncbi:hypothetical protein [Pectinatus haikarae]|nr:hypothetical protein [Pectinatus haikarae]